MTAVPPRQRPAFDRYTPSVQPAVPPRRSRQSAERVDGGGPVIARQARELHSLLRRRLLITVSVFVGFWGVLPIGSLRHMYDPGVPAGARIVLIMQVATAAIIGALGLQLWKFPPKRIRSLRAIEIAMFALGTIMMAIANGYFAQRYGLTAPPVPPTRHPVIDISSTRLDPVTLRWLILIVGYGTMIPNTWRRCATVVFIMVALFLSMLVTQATLSGVNAREMAALLVYPIVWMTVCSVVAIFGSYRVSLLERRMQEVERLGQYRLQRHLGKGGMGDVYLAEHVLLKQPFAVKLLRSEAVSDPRLLQRFEREVQAMARLEHWNTVEIYDYGHAADGSFYYVMEYLPGLTLEELVRTYGPVPPERAIHLLRQICAALSEAHRIGLMHRDVKPGNIIVCERAGIYDVAKLLDFGLVKHVDADADVSLTVEGTVSGTPAYMSPEQSAGLDSVDARSDIYSLGCVAFYLLTGRTPFTNRTPTQLLVAHMHEVAPLASSVRVDVPPSLNSIVATCLEKNPDDRFPTADALSRALGECESCGAWSLREAEAWWRSKGLITSEHPATTQTDVPV
ncbi:MAG TPA: serine/threonine-protein kinase [Gemmatimonadaceae bacterium]|nr:serine/threonine-protein kinase [Gemmatimonadaceae bacterium]